MEENIFKYFPEFFISVAMSQNSTMLFTPHQTLMLLKKCHKNLASSF